MVHRAPFVLVALLFVAGANAADLDPLGAVRGLMTEGVSPTQIPGLLDEQEAAPPQDGDPAPDLGDRLREAFGAQMLAASLAGLAVTAAGLLGFAMVTRYISPKEALKNPQRAMLYGFVKATPGVHLKQLSDEFGMKSSSVLWHVRKLESADLVRSERANGYRVFYPVQGGVEVKHLSRAITALQNSNAQRVFEAVDRHPGLTVRQLSERLTIHPGTVRWHVRKLRDFGLLEELVRDDGSTFFGTPTGAKALATLVGKPTEAPRRSTNATPE